MGALANTFGTQMCNFRREIRAELTRSNEKCDRSENEQFNAQHKLHAQALENLIMDVEQLKATQADRLEIVNKPDDVNCEVSKDLWSAIEGLKKNTDLIAAEMADQIMQCTQSVADFRIDIAGEMTVTSDQLIAKCNEQCKQCFADFTVDVEQLRIEAKKYNEQCI